MVWSRSYAIFWIVAARYRYRLVRGLDWRWRAVFLSELPTATDVERTIIWAVPTMDNYLRSKLTRIQRARRSGLLVLSTVML